jgi:hypothetical protein
MFEIQNQGTKKLYARLPDISSYVVGTQSVINTLSTPPVSPADQDAYIVGAAATGAWAGQTNNVAVWSGYYRIWFFLTPRAGWITLATSSGATLLWNGSSWGTFLSARGQFTLTANLTTTTVTNTGCLATSVISYTPLTANAANDMAIMWFTPGAGSFLITHANNARVDRTFNYAIL